jgi:hypothetical protein
MLATQMKHFQKRYGDTWYNVRSMQSLVKLVRYANVNHELNVNYNRVKYHLNGSGGEYQFNMINNQFAYRFILYPNPDPIK